MGHLTDFPAASPCNPAATTDYPLMLIIPGGFKPYGPIRGTVHAPPIVTISPGVQVTAEDVAEFDAS